MSLRSIVAIRVRLHAYQELARDFLRNTPRAGLFLDMGMGKTFTVLAALEPRHLPCLVVAPKRVCESVWPAEHEKVRPDLSLALAAGTAAQRAAGLAAGADITVISRDNLKEAAPGYRTFVLDELSSFKNKTSQRWKAANRISKAADHVWGLTGTPIPNGLLDLFAQMVLIDRGERLGTTLGGYRNRYFWAADMMPSGVVTRWELRDGAEARIQQKVEDVCLYMSALDHLDLPPVTYNHVTVRLPSEAKRQYKEMSDTLVLDLELIGEEIYSAANAAVLSNKLTQLTSGFIYSDAQDGTWTPLHTTKLDALQEIVDGTGDNILVFYNYIPEREMLRKAFPQARLLDDPGALKAWMRGEVPMLLAHPASAGHGLNLQSGGHTLVWTSLTWDAELYLQANGRLARQGQKHPVVIHHLEAEGTVDKIIADRLKHKIFNQDALLDHLRSPL